MLETNTPSHPYEQGTALEPLLAQIAMGNRQAFDALYHGTANRLFGICLRVLTERSEAEDALQDVFTTVWRKAAQFDARRASATAWLAMIARNKAIDRLRSMPMRQFRTSLDLGQDIEDPGRDGSYAARAVFGASRAASPLAHPRRLFRWSHVRRVGDPDSSTPGIHQELDPPRSNATA
jgi:RNA polymerase sigma-70 factor, ECF subfamily